MALGCFVYMCLLRAFKTNNWHNDGKAIDVLEKKGKLASQWWANRGNQSVESSGRELLQVIKQGLGVFGV